MSEMAKRCAYCNDDDEDSDICSCGKYKEQHEWRVQQMKKSRGKKN